MGPGSDEGPGPSQGPAARPFTGLDAEGDPSTETGEGSGSQPLKRPRTGGYEAPHDQGPAPQGDTPAAVQEQSEPPGASQPDSSGSGGSGSGAHGSPPAAAPGEAQAQAQAVLSSGSGSGATPRQNNNPMADPGHQEAQLEALTDFERNTSGLTDEDVHAAVAQQLRRIEERSQALWDASASPSAAPPTTAATLWPAAPLGLAVGSEAGPSSSSLMGPTAPAPGMPGSTQPLEPSEQLGPERWTEYLRDTFSAADEAARHAAVEQHIRNLEAKLQNLPGGTLPPEVGESGAACGSSGPSPASPTATGDGSSGAARTSSPGSSHPTTRQAEGAGTPTPVDE